jgi:hypothetical protein
MGYAQIRDSILRKDWRWRGLGVALALTLVLLLGIWLAGLWPKPPAIVAALIVAFVITALFFRNIRRWFRRMDWRVAAILLATALSVAGTLLIDALGLGQSPTDYFGAIFAAWIGGLALFAMVGIVVAVVSLARPEEESVESRARILFRGQKGRHIDYIVARIRQIFEQYAEDVSNTMTANEYHAGERKFLVMSEGETRIRSYIDDLPSSYSSKISITDVARPPMGKDPNRLVYLRVGQTSVLGHDFLDSAITYPFDATIAEGADCLIADGMEFWVDAETEANTYQPVRFSQRVRLTVRNHLRGGAPLRLKVSLDDGQTFDDFTLRPGESRLICDTKDVEPDKVVYDVRFLP